MKPLHIQKTSILVPKSFTVLVLDLIQSRRQQWASSLAIREQGLKSHNKREKGRNSAPSNLTDT